LLLAQVVLAPGFHLYQKSVRFEWSELRGVGEPRTSLPPATEVPDQFGGGGSVAVYASDFTVTAAFPVTGRPGEPVVIRGQLHYQGCTDQLCYRPASQAVSASATITPTEGTAPAAGTLGLTLPVRQPAGPSGSTAAPTPSVPLAGGAAATSAPPQKPAAATSWPVALLGAFLAGLLVSLTPCVYPMIPITAAVVGGAVARQGSAGVSAARAFAASLFYVLGLATVYALLGLLAASLGAALHRWLQSAVVRVPVALVFVALALVMFRVLPLRLPSGLGLWLQRVGLGGGFLGVFLVGAGAGLVASPCMTAPLAAILLETARTGDRWLGFWTLFTLAWGMGLVLVLVGTFSGSFLPRAGVWMYGVEKFFGFLLLWGAVWVVEPILGSDLYRLGVGLVVVAGVVFLGGLDALLPESRFAARSKHFLGLAALVLGLLYLVSGLGGVLGVKLGGGARGEEASVGIPFVEGDAASLQRALASGRPVLVDFSADWCAICSELDRTTFRDPEAVREAGRFTALRVDFDRSGDLVARFGVVGPPTILLFPSGATEPVRRLVGAVTPGQLVEAMRETR
jgi:thiol:disulfide interchange protein DsbD